MPEGPVSPCPEVFRILFPDGSEARCTAVTLALTRGHQILGLIPERSHDRTCAWPARGAAPARGPAPILWLEWREGALFPVAEAEGRRLHDGWLDHVLRGLERDAKRP